MSRLFTVCRKEHFNAAHRLFREDWTEEKNNEVFGKCSNANFHGHNYELIIKITGESDPDTGYVIDLKILSQIVKENVLTKFDHKNLNLDVPEFKNLNPTAENIAWVIWNLLRERLDIKYQLKIVLYETERNFVEYPVD
ncbi:MAG TPA: 6-carboxytetrahydropterin synthase [Cytophagaceae bacterium]